MVHAGALALPGASLDMGMGGPQRRGSQGALLLPLGPPLLATCCLELPELSGGGEGVYKLCRGLPLSLMLVRSPSVPASLLPLQG